MKSPLTHVVLGLASLALAGCSDTKTTAASAPAPVSAPAPAPSDPGEELVISGPIVVENQVDLAAQRDGVVARIVADTGTKVHKGQLLAELDERQLSAERQAAEAKAKSIAADVKNWRQDWKVKNSDFFGPKPMLRPD